MKIEPGQDSQHIAQELEERLYEHNSNQIDRNDGGLFSRVVLDETGSLVAGVAGWTWAGVCEITQLWVSEGLRNRGIGKQLLEAAEQEARSKNHTMDDDLKLALQHVLWIGGSTDAGKTSVARAIAARYGLQIYHFDRHESSHIERLIDAGSAYFQQLVTKKNAEGLWELRDIDEYWVLRSPEVMAQETITSWKERFPLVVEDLKAMPREPMIVAEGPGLFPENVCQVLGNPQQAIWLVATEAFKRVLVKQRAKPSVRAQTSDPERATENLIARDMLMARLVREEAQERGLKLYEVDGSSSLEAVIAVVEHHFGQSLQSHRG